jgi:hypothetical protein
MKLAFQVAALVVVLTAGTFWFTAGANRGWTKTSVAVKTVDEITGIEGIDYRPQFVPGLDFVGGALLGAGVLAGASLLFRNKAISTNKT